MRTPWQRSDTVTPHTTAPLALGQFKDALFADLSVHVYAVLMATRLPGLAQRLQTAQAQQDIHDHDCLWPGALTPDQQAKAPYLVWLRRGTEFTDWLVGASMSDLPDWGVLLRSRSTFLALRAHTRALCHVRLADGQPIALDWMDPAVLKALLPLATPDQLDEILSPVDTLLWAQQSHWLQCQLAAGQLSTHRHDLVA